MKMMFTLLKGSFAKLYKQARGIALPFLRCCIVPCLQQSPSGKQGTISLMKSSSSHSPPHPGLSGVHKET